MKKANVMADGMVIALDAMGGDHGLATSVPGAALSLERRPDTRFLMYGDGPKLKQALDAHPALRAASDVIHADVAVAMDAKPSEALRQGRRSSSMWLAIDAVRRGEAAAIVSAGNTGALMAMAKFCLKTVRGVERPAIVAIWPTVKSECLVLDVGANVGASARQLVEFSMMGATMARALFSLEHPRIGLLNVGVEEVKGLEHVREAHSELKRARGAYNYVGFVEGDAIGHDIADVVVTEGFSGNIALKTAEGTARQIASYLRAAMEQSTLSMVGAYLAKDAFEALKIKLDPRRINGGVFLGLNGIVIKSHGGTDATGFASAVDLGYDMARAELVTHVADELSAHAEQRKRDAEMQSDGGVSSETFARSA